jgi:hypothetical protein
VRSVSGRPVRVYLSGVASRTHVLYAASYLRHLLASGAPHVVVVSLGLRPFLGEHRVSEDDVRGLLPDDERLEVVTGLPPAEPGGEDRVYLAIGSPGLKPLARLRLQHPGRRLRVVVVDEGLGSYGTWRTRRDAWRREGHAAWWATTRALVVEAGRRALTDERWALYRHTRGGWVVDQAVAGALLPPADGEDRQPHAVLLAQPFVQLGLLTDDETRELVVAVAAACQEAGLRLLLRPHPAEPTLATVEGVEVLPSTSPAEVDPMVRSARAALGTASTALLNIAALGLAPTVRLDVPGTRHSEAALSDTQREILATFLPRAVPVEELPRALKNLS